MECTVSGQEPLAKPDPSELAKLKAKKMFSVQGCGVIRRRVVKQLEARRRAEKAWGDDPRRGAIAVFISRQFMNHFRLPNDYFLPDDSFDTMVLAEGEDGLTTVELMMDMEEALGINIPEKGAAALCDMTFGEVVDYLMSLPSVQKCPPPEGPCAPEFQICPSSAVFWDLRQFARSSLGIEARQFRPEARLQDLLGKKHARRFSDFLFSRYGIAPCFQPRVLGVLPLLRTWLAVCLVSSAVVWSMYGFQRAKLCAVVGVIPAIIILYLVAAWKWPWGVNTVSDLVEWILDKRCGKKFRRQLRKRGAATTE